jgi:hypothetical protein
MLGQARLVIVFICYVAVNLYLWSLPIAHPALFFTTLPLAVLFFGFFLWHVLRMP